MPITASEATFARLGRERATRLVAALAGILDDSSLVGFSLDESDEAQRRLLFDLCFVAIAVFEDRGGIEDVGQKYYPRLVFEAGMSSGEPHFLVAATPIHGLLEDPILDAGLSDARRRASDRSD